MSSLRKILAEQSAQCPPVVRCVETEFSPVTMVTFCPWQAKEWTVPWSRLDAMSFFRGPEAEQLELFFPHHQVIAIGENLRGIMDDILVPRVSCLRDLPASHRASLSANDVFVTKLEVRLLTDPPRHG